MTQDSSVFYHNEDPTDPFVEDPNRSLQYDDYYSCPACTCTGPSDSICRCSCHSQRRHH